MTSPQVEHFSHLLSPATLKLLSASGSDLIHTIGMDVVRGVLLDVLTGRNIRDSTEILTRRRIAALNLAMVNLFIKGVADSSDFINLLPVLATEVLTHECSKSERRIARWMLGLTDKAFQNVLRDNPDALDSYRERYIQTCQEVIDYHVQEYGELVGEVRLASGERAAINWLFLIYLLNTIGAQTLTIRGSEKSAYGKLFEKLILGSLLSILGFRYVPPGQPEEFRYEFWLSSQGEKRESDATLLYEEGRAVRFDIGFIGRGNPEISLDKVSRFERQVQLNNSSWYMATIIIVDRVGPQSRIPELARQIGGKIIQMSGGYWPRQVAKELHDQLGFQHELLDMNEGEIADYLQQQLEEVPLEDFIRSGRSTKKKER